MKKERFRSTQGVSLKLKLSSIESSHSVPHLLTSHCPVLQDSCSQLPVILSCLVSCKSNFTLNESRWFITVFRWGFRLPVKDTLGRTLHQ